jgi:Spy/CpxP family protein refolding chaperone
MSRFVALAAAISLVVSGVVIGALSVFFVLPRPGGPGGPGGPHPPQPPPPPFTREMESQLDLSDDQWNQIQTILEENRRETDAIRRELRPRLDKSLEATRARIGALLSPEQRVKFDQLVREDRRRADRFFLEGPPPPRGGPPPR